MTLLEDLKKLRRTRWSRLAWPSDCPSLAGHLTDATTAAEGRVALAEAPWAVEGLLGSEASLIRYSGCASEVVSALLGLGEETAATAPGHRASRAAEPVCQGARARSLPV